MKITTSWSFRKTHLNHYGVHDFQNDWDYFVYLHINPHVQFIHLGGTLLGLSLFPWAMIHLFRDHSLWQTFVFTFCYYGLGFISHWSGDGQISGTWKQLLKTYRYAAKMNVMILRGKFKAEEVRVLKQYPEVRWMYFADAPKPKDLA